MKKQIHYLAKHCQKKKKLLTSKVMIFSCTTKKGETISSCRINNNNVYQGTYHLCKRNNVDMPFGGLKCWERKVMCTPVHEPHESGHFQFFVSKG